MRPVLLRPAHLALAVSLALNLALVPFTHAAEPVQRYDIPAAPLDDVLRQIARQSGQSIVADPALLEGRQARAVRGDLSVQQAVQQALAGSGLQLRVTANGSLTLEPAATDGSVQLGATTVSGSGLGEVTEHSGSYTTGAMASATKLALSPRETPQSVSVVTRQRMDDQAMTTLSDVVKHTPGLTLTQWGAERPRFNSRGFSLENLMYDGVPVAYEEAALSTGSLAMYDRVEVVRGATGLMEGAGLPGGSINLVRKRPTVAPQVSLNGGFGSWDNRLFELDASSALNEQGSLRGRTVLSYQKKDSFIDDLSNERTLLYGIVEADLNDATTLAVGVSYSNENNPGADWNGIGTAADDSFLPVSRSTRMSPSWSYWNKESTTVFADLEHRFANDWKARAAATRITSEMNMEGTFISQSSVDANGRPSMTLRGGAYDYDRDQYSLDGYVSGPFSLGGRTHSAVFGASRRVSDWDNIGGPFKTRDSFDLDALDIITFDPTNWDPKSMAKPPITAYGAVSSQQRVEQSGLYGTVRLSLSDPLTLIAGARLDWYKMDKVFYDGDYPYGQADFSVTGEFTPYVGVVYDLDEHYSVYASWTRIFQPQSEQTASGGVLEPIQGTNYEIGLKGEHFDGRLNSSLAIFQVDLENLPESLTQSACSDPFASCYASAGEIRSRGIELELSGALTPDWQVSAGYTYNHAERIKESDYSPISAFSKGKRYGTNLPENLFKLYTRYRLPGELERWQVGGGMRTQSRIYSPWGVEQGGYTVFDLNGSYAVTRHLDLDFNLNNVFDKHYYSTITGPTEGNFVGEPRNFMVTARYRLF
ncbi:TonB-dependent siderophore receptor [Pseudomonas japonica]|uniref:TonB-dependent siderophore receptor n=1 Tax=Pseudomonas japonica TaxID=256466 RepID=UPI003A8A1205